MVTGGAAGTPEPAQAAGAELSVLGFGLGNEATSDPHNSLDDAAVGIGLVAALIYFVEVSLSDALGDG